MSISNYYTLNTKNPSVFKLIIFPVLHK